MGFMVYNKSWGLGFRVETWGSAWACVGDFLCRIRQLEGRLLRSVVRTSPSGSLRFSMRSSGSGSTHSAGATSLRVCRSPVKAFDRCSVVSVCGGAAASVDAFQCGAVWVSSFSQQTNTGQNKCCRLAH